MAVRRVEIGVVRSVNPARRELRIRPGWDDVQAGAPLQWVYVLDADGGETRCRVEQVHGEIVTLAAGVARDTVARMRGAAVCADVERSEADWRGQLDVLEGFDVVDEAGDRLGAVTAVYMTGANGAIEVAQPGGGSMLLPVIDRVIVAVDMERGQVTVRDIASYKVE